MSQEQRPRNIFREDVGSVFRARDFFQTEVLRPQAVLHPQVCRRKVPDFSEAPATADPDGRCGVRFDQDLPVHPEVGCHTLQPEGDGGATADTPQFCLGARERHGALCI